MSWNPNDVLSPSQYRRITDERLSNPAGHWMNRRRRRTVLAPSGRLVLIAADHPARGVNAVGDAPLAMADRRDLLSRIMVILQNGAADGVMATMDVLDDLMILHRLECRDGGAGLLHDKVLVASMNRGGLAGAAWELDDPLTGPDARACAAADLDGGKLLLRLCLTELGTLRTIEQCALAVTELKARGLACFLEPLAVRKVDGGFEMLREADELARAVGIAQALGASSNGMWLKLPWCEDFATVAAATTLPILLLGGAGRVGMPPFATQLTRALDAGANVRGVMVGRSMLFPANGDPLATARLIYDIVHGS